MDFKPVVVHRPLRKPNVLKNTKNIRRHFFPEPVITKIPTSPNNEPLSGLKWGEKLADYMLEADWNQSGGWSRPRIGPVEDLSIHPSATGLHYGIQAFDGMKAFKRLGGKSALFRPREQVRRFRESCEKNALPAFDENQLLTFVKQLVLLNEHQIPKATGCALYIRPCAFSTDASLEVGAPKKTKLLVTCFPCEKFFTASKKISLKVCTDYVRAWPKGCGNYKLGGNYAPTMLPLKEAKREGFSQLLWTLPLDNEDYLITEGGACNLFVAIRDGNGISVLTPPDDGLVLPGIIRRSVIEMCKSLPVLDEPITVVEKPIKISELRRLFESGSVVDFFLTGTGVGVLPVDSLQLGDDQTSLVNVPKGHEVSLALKNLLQFIQIGKFDSTWMEPVD